MAAWGYEFYLRVLKVSLTKFVSLSGHVISSIYHWYIIIHYNNLLV